MNNQDTPETDAQSFSAETIALNMPPPDHLFCHAAFTKKLERERGRLVEALEYIAHAGLSGRHMQDVARTALCPPTESIRPL